MKNHQIATKNVSMASAISTAVAISFAHSQYDNAHPNQSKFGMWLHCGET